MKYIQSSSVIKTALICAAFLALQACAPSASGGGELNVASAFESSGAMIVKPYTRTIFSTTDF